MRGEGGGGEGVRGRALVKWSKVLLYMCNYSIMNDR